MTGAEFRAKRKEMGLSQAELSKRLGCSARSVVTAEQRDFVTAKWALALIAIANGAGFNVRGPAAGSPIKSIFVEYSDLSQTPIAISVLEGQARSEKLVMSPLRYDGLRIECDLFSPLDYSLLRGERGDE